MFILPGKKCEPIMDKTIFGNLGKLAPFTYSWNHSTTIL